MSAFTTRRGSARWTACAVTAICFATSSAWGQVDTGGGDAGAGVDPLAGVDIMKVEEDWVLDIANPDPEADCPQIITVFGPSDPTIGTHAVVELNHGTLPDFSEGGMQLSVWWGDWLIGYRRQHAPAELYYAIERLTYTTVTEVQNNRLKLFVANGESLTWGEFGDDGTSSMKVELLTERANLNEWNPDHSINHSRVTYGANRVNKYVRSEIRYYTESGLHYTDSNESVIHRLTEDEFAPDPVNAGD